MPGDFWGQMLLPRHKKLHLVSLGGSTHTPINETTGRPGVLEAPVLVFSSVEEMQGSHLNVSGKIVLFNVVFTTYGDTVGIRSAGQHAAAQAGAAAALIRSVTPYSLQTPHTGSGKTSGKLVSDIPNAAVSLEDADQMQRMWDRGQEIVVQLYMEGNFTGYTPQSNVVMTLQGSDLAHEYVLLGGHIDSWFNAEGAMDDGGGTFAAWHALRLIAKLGLKPRRTLMAVAWVDEEQYQSGAAAFKAAHENMLDNISIALESDTGTFVPYALDFQGSQAAYEVVLTVAETLKPISAGNTTVNPFEPDTDIGPLCRAGVPCGGLRVLDPRIGNYINNPCLPITGGEAPLASSWPGRVAPHGGGSGYFFYHHTEADTVSHINDTQLRLSTAALASWAYAFAMSPAQLRRTGAAASPTPLPPLPGTSEGSSCKDCAADSRILDVGIIAGLTLLAICASLVAYIFGVSAGVAAPDGVKGMSLRSVAIWALCRCCKNSELSPYKNLTDPVRPRMNKATPYGGTV